MKILSVETSTMLGGVAVVDNSQGLLGEVRLNVKTTHSERLMAAIDFVLGQAGQEVSDIDVFAVAIGPGSFTGLRIGLSTVKGLCFASGKLLVTVPTLDAFAENFPCSSLPVCLMLDARKDEVYTAVYAWEGKSFRKVIPELSLKPEEIVDMLEGEVILAGEGVLRYQERIIKVMGERAIFAAPDKMVPSPANVAVIGLEKARKGEFTNVTAAVPFYVRKSEAELKWSGKG